MSKQKTTEQIAFEAYYAASVGIPRHNWPSQEYAWKAVVAAVIAHHEQQKDPFAEYKSALAAGKRIQWADSRDTPTYWADYIPGYHAEPGRYPLVKWRIKPEPKCIRPVPSAVLTTRIPPLALTHGNHSFAATQQNLCLPT